VGYNRKRNELLRELRYRAPESGRCWEESKNFVPGGLLSGARKMEPYPIYIDHGKGPYVWDIDGNRYIDNVMSFGVHLFGHNPGPIIKAARDQTERGVSYGAPHVAEVEYTRKLIECIPCAEQVMLCNSGTEATLLAWRLMRAATNKPKIAKFEGCYHGWHDYAQWSVSIDRENMGPPEQPNMTPDSAGMPDAVRDTMLILPFHEAAFSLIEENASDLAGVAIEPFVGTGTIPVSIEFLQRLREITEKHGLLLHFDEVITGFRVALGGYQEYTGIVPDVATYGKAIGGGFPVGAVACSRKLSEEARKADEGFFAAGTFSGNPMTLAAGGAAIDYMIKERHIYQDMMQNGEYLRDEFNLYAQSKGYPLSMTGLGSMFCVHALSETPKVPRDILNEKREITIDLQLHYRNNNLLIPWMHLAFFSSAHTREVIDQMLEGMKASLDGVMDWYN